MRVRCICCVCLHRPDRRAVAGPGASESPADAASHGPASEAPGRVISRIGTHPSAGTRS